MSGPFIRLFAIDSGHVENEAVTVNMAHVIFMYDYDSGTGLVFALHDMPDMIVSQNHRQIMDLIALAKGGDHHA